MARHITCNEGDNCKCRCNVCVGAWIDRDNAKQKKAAEATKETRR